eukprot:4782935-Prymnesium_polylepis.2
MPWMKTTATGSRRRNDREPPSASPRVVSDTAVSPSAVAPLAARRARSRCRRVLARFARVGGAAAGAATVDESGTVRSSAPPSSAPPSTARREPRGRRLTAVRSDPRSDPIVARAPTAVTLRARASMRWAVGCGGLERGARKPACVQGRGIGSVAGEAQLLTTYYSLLTTHYLPRDEARRRHAQPALQTIPAPPFARGQRRDRRAVVVRPRAGGRGAVTGEADAGECSGRDD